MADDNGPPEGDHEESFVRPYIITGGRTVGAAGDIPIETLVVSRRTGERLGPDHAVVVDFCSREPLSVAEIAVHFPRIRLPAHVIRDQALAVSGLLSERLGGASVKPYMPPGIWRSISNNKYQQDHGAGLYRRSNSTSANCQSCRCTTSGFGSAPAVSVAAEAAQKKANLLASVANGPSPGASV